ncbi:hypothetical protein DBR06_SOUSAS3410117, partial [Sousa chinensis]
MCIGRLGPGSVLGFRNNNVEVFEYLTLGDGSEKREGSGVVKETNKEKIGNRNYWQNRCHGERFLKLVYLTKMKKKERVLMVTAESSFPIRCEEK